MRTWVVILLFAILAISSVSWAEEEQIIEADHPYIQYSGRIDFGDPQKPCFDWPGISIWVRFTGRVCKIRLTDINNEYNVFIDGKFGSVLRADPSQKIYTLAKGLSEGEHTVLLTKRTEGSYGLAVFEGFIFERGTEILPPPERATRRIEWIGDSLTCGYGNEGPSANCKNLRDHENNYLAFAPVASRALNAEYHIVAISGKGMVRNYGDPKTRSTDPMPSYYERTCQNLPASHWDFGKWTPDAVVITLGANDYSTEPHPGYKIYMEAYKQFISVVRGRYPNAHIFCLSFFGMPGPQIHSVVQSINESGDSRVHFLEDNRMCGLDELGCDYHPKKSVHEKLGRYLNDAIRKTMGW